jgi:hypothetical protein
MPLADRATRVVAKRLPKVIGPRAHAIADYATAGALFVLGALFWPNNKRAAVGAFLCGSAVTATSLLTDYPGGVMRVISFDTHARIDAGLAGLTATMPNFLAFKDEEEAKYFRGCAVATTLIAGLTDFEEPSNVIEMPRRTA